jgi:5'-3' exonuclease
MKVYLVDGTYELFRAYYAVPKSQNRQGVEVAATRGLCRSLLALLGESEVTHLACAFDHVIESFRNDLYDGYKTSQGIEPDLWSQFPLAERATRALGIVTWPMVEFEADDAIAAACAKFKDDPRVEQVLICTPDKDMAQLVEGSKVVLLDRRRQITYDDAGVRVKWGVPPSSIPDWLALVGDSSDGYPGLPGWGAKSASAVLARYEHLERIPEQASDWEVAVRSSAKLAQTLAEQREHAMLFRHLATLRLDAPVGNVDEWRWLGPTTALDEWAQRLDARGIVARARRLAERRQP